MGHTQNQSKEHEMQEPNLLSKTGMDYRTWLQQRKKQSEFNDSEDAMGSKFEITRKTNSTILEESSKAEDDESIIENRAHHRPANSKINPMLLLTNTDQPMYIKANIKDYQDTISGKYNMSYI
jgi:hypothetical protein